VEVSNLKALVSNIDTAFATRSLTGRGNNVFTLGSMKPIIFLRPMERQVSTLVFRRQATKLTLDVVDIKKSGLSDSCHDGLFTNDSKTTGNM